MADPICRWRNPYLSTVMELIDLLPKSEMTQEQARQLVIDRSPYDFYRTPYQLACQLGLYHETNGRYFPKYTYNPTEEDVRLYLQNWILHYCVPNPYTRGFDDLQPFSIHSEICRILQRNSFPTNWNEIRIAIFGDSIGNNDILVNAINTYSPIISIQGEIVQLKENKSYEDLTIYIDVDISLNRSNKEYFFDLFSIPNRVISNSHFEYNQDILQDINQQDIDLIDEIQNLPNLTQTEKNQIVAARIGQGIFRRNLISECGFCPLTLIDETRLLIASHIKPWRSSSNLERLDPKNGLLLTPTFDKLFDKGIITFSPTKQLMISSSLSDENRQRLNLVESTVYSSIPMNGREEFFNYHRNEIFNN